jgi:hypothetical protein
MRKNLPPRNREFLDRLLAYAAEDTETGCWNWTGSLNRGGYGRLNIEGKTYSAHRLIYWAATGAWPGELFCCHKCDNRRCVNPWHLFLGTRRDNIDDMLRKGRQNHGQSSGKTRLTEEDVAVIFDLRRQGWKQSAIANRFGVVPHTISRILAKKRWVYF